MNIKKASFLICFGLYLTGYSQKIDSLKALLPGKSGSERVDILRELACKYINVDNEMAKICGWEGYQLAMKQNDSFRIIRDGRLFATTLRRLGAVDSAIKVYHAILPVIRSKQLNNDLKVVSNVLGISYSMVARYDEALKYYLESLNLREALGDTAEIAMALHNIGFVYYKLKNYNKALVYWRQSLDLKNKIRSNFDLDLLLINMASAHAYKNNLDATRYFVKRALDACGNNCSNRIITYADFCLGVGYFHSREPEIAERYFLKSYSLANKVNDSRLQFDNIDYLSQIYIQQNRLEKAKHFLKEAEALIKKGASYNLELIKIYSRFFQMYNKTKNYKQTALYQQKYIQLKDSIYNETLTTNLMKVEADYLERENKARIEAQEQVLVLNKEIINRQRILNIVTGFLVLILIAFAIMVWKNYVRKKKANVILDEKIRERTTELELSRDVLLKACRQRDLLVARASRDIKTTLSTMQGLCALVPKDISDPATRQYICEMDKTSSDLSDSLKPLFWEKDPWIR